MASTRKSRSVNKRVAKVNEESPDKDGGNRSKQRKRKLSDMLGSQWSEEELERFYEAYRKYGKDWKKVAGVLRNRSIDMVEALYNMNRAYLSLPEGTASVVGLIAMMTDHYNILDGSDSERESNDVPGIPRKPQKRGRGKYQQNTAKVSDVHIPDLLHFPSITPNYGCMSSLKKKRSGGNRPRAVGKRTPRFPVPYSYDKHDRGQFVSPSKRGSKSHLDGNDDEVAHGAVLVLAEALQRGGSPQISHTPNRRKELVRPSSARNSGRMHTESVMPSAKFIGTAKEEDYLEGSIGSREAENGDFTRDSSYMMDTEGVGTVEVRRKGKKFNGKKSKVQRNETNFDDIREACSGTEEGLNLSSAKDDVTDSKYGRPSPQSSKKRSRQLLFEDESAALDALCTLADVSTKFAAPSAVESESSVQFKEDKRTVGTVGKSGKPEATSANRQKDKLKSSVAKEKGNRSLTGVDAVTLRNAKLGRDSAIDASSLSEAKKLASQSAAKLRKGKGKSMGPKIQPDEPHTDSPLFESQKTEVLVEDGKKAISKAKRVGLAVPLPKLGRSSRLPEQSSSSTDPLRPGTDSSLSAMQAPTVNQVALPTKLRSRRKMDSPKALILNSRSPVPENIGTDRSHKYTPSFHDRTVELKDKLSHCLSSQMLRRWCAFEWFYSSIDYPWYAKREFVEYLNHVGLGDVPRLTRVEWGVIRSSLGKPRRLSQQFLREEKEKLEQYRESVRTHYTELRNGTREGLPTDLARPLSVGQRVTACHPRTREFHDGSVLTVVRNKCRIQFDRSELGCEFVMDIDCMPLNPLEIVPEALRRQNLVADRLCGLAEPKMTHQAKDLKTGGQTKFTPSENLETADGASQLSSPINPANTLKQTKGNTVAIPQAKAAVNDNSNTQKVANSQPSTLAQIHARDADIRALSEVNRALEKKEALVLELKNMNDDIYENQKNGDDSLKDYEPFKKQYATVVVQLKEVDDQVKSAVTYLRDRNTYHVNSPPWLKSKTTGGAPVRLDQPACLPQDSGSHVVQILESSRLRAHAMVDVAVQAMSSLKEGEDPFSSVGEALDLARNHHGTDSGVSAARSFTLQEPGNGSLVNQEASNPSTSEAAAKTNINGTKPNNTSDRTEVQVPKELISSCVATLLMIQTCTERQYPPAEVAQILDSAVTSLQPCCSQNLPIYREIQMCMGLVKNQILALIPT